MKWVLMMALYSIDPNSGLYIKKPMTAYFSSKEACEKARGNIVNMRVSDKELIVGKCMLAGERI